MELPARISLNSLIFFIENYCCPVKKENIFMLRFENSLLCKQNGITSQIVYYHFEDRVLYFKGSRIRGLLACYKFKIFACCCR